MLKKSQQRRNEFYRKALITSRQCDLCFADTVDLYCRMAESKRIARLSKRYGTTVLWDEAEERGGMLWISVPVMLHVKNEIIGWRTFFDKDDLMNAPDRIAHFNIK
jgi:hypothetical protein